MIEYFLFPYQKKSLFPILRGLIKEQYQMSTLGFAGMDARTQTLLHAAFAAAVDRLQLDLELCPNANADFVVVDMDCLYGPLSWLQLSNSGRTVIGYTAASRSQTHFHLPRDFDDAVLDALLAELAILPKPSVIATTTPPRTTPAPPPVSNHFSQTSSVGLDSMTLAQWLASDRLRGLLRLGDEDDTHIILDMETGRYYGPPTLKPLIPLFEQALHLTDFQVLDEQSALDKAGAEQQLARLVWFATLLRGRGRLLPQHDKNAHYRLLKWFQTEREYPKHFRIASALLKAPATLPEIARMAMASEAEVADFLNACLAIGTVEPVQPMSESPAEPSRNGLLGGLRRH
ncbi:hypothetical protein CO608_06260 [Lysobacteraceae bacterium NML08-0793]|nr:hypothetical protein CO608_06260 [Xanthomonadaceae bacterium NML08-0793]